MVAVLRMQVAQQQAGAHAQAVGFQRRRQMRARLIATRADHFGGSQLAVVFPAISFRDATSGSSAAIAIARSQSFAQLVFQAGCALASSSMAVLRNPFKGFSARSSRPAFR